ncbi:MAG TPA: diacylglycerol kinase family protein [Solirubrobacteraceae bacterium]|nr:diacylglycerol kinase family protein [Solirubrobacteraceae bacterium]
MAAPIRLLVNPSAGGGRAARVAPVAETALRALGLLVERTDTRNLEHARELGREAAGNGETIVAVSGDGLVGALADALRVVPGAVLGIVPGGRGNDLARVLGIPNDAHAAAAVIADGHVASVDLGLVETDSSAPRAFVGIASAGFDSDANRIANEAPPWLGPLVYAYGALRTLASWQPARFQVELDPPGERHTFTGYSVGAANSKAYGGGMYAAPGAMLDDGLLDVVVLGQVSKVAFLTRIMPAVFKGKHVEQPEVSVFRAREIEISSNRPFTMYADGDPIGDLPLRVRALHGAIAMLTPRAAPADSAFAAVPAASREA